MTSRDLQRQMADPRFPAERIDDLAEDRAAGGEDAPSPDWFADDEERRIWRSFGE